MSPVACTKNAVFRAFKPAVQRFQQRVQNLPAAQLPACVQQVLSLLSCTPVPSIYISTTYTRWFAQRARKVRGRIYHPTCRTETLLVLLLLRIAGALPLLCSFCFRMAASGEWSKQLESAKADGMSFLKRPCVRNSLMSGIATGTLMGIHRVRVGRESKATGMTYDTCRSTRTAEFFWLIGLVFSTHVLDIVLLYEWGYWVLFVVDT